MTTLQELLSNMKGKHKTQASVLCLLKGDI